MIFHLDERNVNLEWYGLKREWSVFFFELWDNGHWRLDCPEFRVLKRACWRQDPYGQRVWGRCPLALAAWAAVETQVHSPEDVGGDVAAVGKRSSFNPWMVDSFFLFHLQGFLPLTYRFVEEYKTGEDFKSKTIDLRVWCFYSTVWQYMAHTHTHTTPRKVDL